MGNIGVGFCDSAGMDKREKTGAKFHAALQMSEHELRGSLVRALHQLDLGLLIYEGVRIVHANDVVERLTGYTVEELYAAEDIFSFIAPEQVELVKARHTARAAGEPVPTRYTIAMRHKDGGTVDLELSIAEVHYNETFRVLVLVRDVTEETAIERRARQAHKMEAIGKLAQGVAHDFNSYLTAMRLTAEALALRVTDPESRKLLAELEQVTKGAGKLTRRLVTFGGQDPMRPTVLDINVVVFEMLTMLQRLLGERFDIAPDLEPGLPPVRADEGQLQQVLVNLVLNAGESMPDGGRVVIRTRAPNGGSEVQLVVEDEGCGMASDVAERAFEPFFGTKGEQGSGMGLSIVYGIVKQCAGTVCIESEPGQGTTLRVTLPAATPPFPLPHPAPPPAIRDAAPRLLLVEDDAFVRDLLVEGLERLGFVVRAAGGGSEAIQLLDEYHPDVLVTDVVMPDGDGTAVAMAYRDKYPEGVVLFVSGYPNSVLDDGYPDAKFAFVNKPFTAGEIAEVIRKQLKLRP